MPKAPSSPLPASDTSGQLGRLLGISERAVAARRLDGRAPTADGGIDLAALCRAGLDALAKRPADGMPTGERHDAGMRAAASVTAHLVMAAVQSPAPGEDTGQAAARALRDALDLIGAGPARWDTASGWSPWRKRHGGSDQAQDAFVGLIVG